MTDTQETWDNVKVVAGRERRTQTYRKGGRWRRTLVEVTGRKHRLRYHVRLARWWVRVPWLAWVMFS